MAAYGLWPPFLNAEQCSMSLEQLKTRHNDMLLCVFSISLGSRMSVWRIGLNDNRVRERRYGKLVLSS